MSMQRTTCCSLLRLSHATLPGKTSISGCCSSEARSCARWEWHIAIVMPLHQSVRGMIHVVLRRRTRAYHLPTVYVFSVPMCLLSSHFLLFPALRVKSCLWYAAQWTKGSPFREVSITNCRVYFFRCLLWWHYSHPRLNLPHPVYPKLTKWSDSKKASCVEDQRLKGQ